MKIVIKFLLSYIFVIFIIFLLSCNQSISSDSNSNSKNKNKDKMSDSQIVAEDKASLNLQFASGDSASNVTQNIILINTGNKGSTITWSSDNVAVSSDGIVIRPLYGSGNQTVTLTATITKGSSSDTKTFIITVIQQPQSDAESVAQDKASLNIKYASGDNVSSVTNNLTLPTSGACGTTISWSSDNTSIISISGSVSRPSYIEGDKTITLTALITKGSSSDTKIFILTVKRKTSLSWSFVDGNLNTGLNKDTSKIAVDPAMAVFNSELYVAWTENNSSTTQIRVRKYNGSTWSWVDGGGTTGINVTTTESAASPNLMVFNNQLYAIWNELKSGFLATWVKRYDGGTTWTLITTETFGLNTLVGATSGRPVLCVCNNTLYAAWNAGISGSPNQIHVKRYDGGTTWTSIDGNVYNGLNYNTSNSAYPPGLISINNDLYLIWAELNSNSTLIIHVKHYEGGATWTSLDGVNGLNYDINANGFGYQLVVFNNSLYAYWIENNLIRIKSYNGSSWSSADGNAGYRQNISNYLYDYAPPKAINYDNKLFFTWGEDIDSDPYPIQIRAGSYNGSMTMIDGNSSTAGLNYNTTTSAYMPAIIEYNNEIYIAWYELNGIANQIRVKKNVR